MVIEGWVGWTLLGLPWAALLIAAIRAHRSSREPRSRMATRRATAPVYIAKFGAVPAPLSAPQPDTAAPTPPPLTAPAVTLLGPSAGGRVQLRSQVSAAEAAGNDQDLPALHLALARLEIASGSLDDAGEHLRICVRLSVHLKLPIEHAAARLELGDIACQHGDMTTACEHWQIARSLFQDAGRAADRDVATQRMQKNGCPSDWVLNQF